MSNLPLDKKTADTSTWRYIGHALPDLDAVPGALILDVLQRTPAPGNKLVYCETQYLGNGEFHGVYGETVYWSYQRPMPTEYLTEAEASADLDVCGYAGKWAKAKASCALALEECEMCPADYWLAVRLHFLELGGGWLSERPQRVAVIEGPARRFPAFVAEMHPPLEPTNPRQG